MQAKQRWTDGKDVGMALREAEARDVLQPDEDVKREELAVKADISNRQFAVKAIELSK